MRPKENGNVEPCSKNWEKVPLKVLKCETLFLPWFLSQPVMVSAFASLGCAPSGTGIVRAQIVMGRWGSHPMA